MSFHKKFEAAKLEAREIARHSARSRLRVALKQLIEGQSIYLFGSITKPFCFHRLSDIDLALAQEPSGKSIYLLTAELEELLGCSIDLQVLSECRFAEKIKREGELWIS